MFMLGVAVSSFVAGRLVDRFSARPILLICALLAGGGIALCSQIHTIGQLRIFYAVAGLGVGATWSVPGSAVQRHFHGKNNSGLVLAIVISGVGVGGLIFAPLADYLIINHGWRQAYIIIGIVCFALVGWSALVIKGRPTHDDISAVQPPEHINKSSVSAASISHIIKRPTFIGITFLVCLAELTFQAIAVHLVPHATDVGISATSSAFALGIIGGISIPGRILAGIMSEKTGWKSVMALSLGCIALCIIWLLMLKSTWMLYSFVVLYGIVHGMAMTAEVGILGEFFGMRWLGGLLGISSSIAFIAAALSPYILGFFYDSTGSYTTAFFLIIGLLLSGSILAVFMKKGEQK